MNLIYLFNDASIYWSLAFISIIINTRLDYRVMINMKTIYFHRDQIFFKTPGVSWFLYLHPSLFLNRMCVERHKFSPCFTILIAYIQKMGDCQYFMTLHSIRNWLSRSGLWMIKVWPIRILARTTSSHLELRISYFNFVEIPYLT